MDIIISANDEIKRMIKEIPLEDNKKISSVKFQDMIISIIKDTKENAV